MTVLECDVTTLFKRVVPPYAVPEIGAALWSKRRWFRLVKVGGTFAVLGPGASALRACLALGLGTSALSICLYGQYIWYRYGCANPVDQEPWQQIWSWIFFVFESLSLLGSVTVLLVMSCCRQGSHKTRKHPQAPMI